MEAKRETEHQPVSELWLLLVRLDEEVSRYYNSLNSIRSARISLQSSQTESDSKYIDETAKILGVERYSDGLLRQLDELIGRLVLLNTDAESEAKLLNEYI